MLCLLENFTNINATKYDICNINYDNITNMLHESYLVLMGEKQKTYFDKKSQLPSFTVKDKYGSQYPEPIN